MKTENIKQLSILPLLVSIILGILVFVLASVNSSVYAANPGCYARSSLGGASEISPYTCPTPEYSRLVTNEGLCIVFAAGSSGVSPTGTSVDCAALTVGQTRYTDESPVGPGTPETVSQPIETDCEPDPGVELNRGNCAIIDYIVIGINFLAALAGIVLVASLMIAGFTYMTARDNAGQVEKAKSRIIQTLIALALFIFMYAFLNFLVPGGVL